MASTSTCREKGNSQPGTACSWDQQEYLLANPHAPGREARVWFSIIKQGPLSEGLRLVSSEMPGGERAAREGPVLTLLLDPD